MTDLEIVEYYKTHTQKETISHFGIDLNELKNVVCRMQKQGIHSPKKILKRNRDCRAMLEFYKKNSIEELEKKYKVSHSWFIKNVAYPNAVFKNRANYLRWKEQL